MAEPFLRLHALWALGGPLGDTCRALDQIGQSLQAIPGLQHGDPDFTNRTRALPSLIRRNTRGPNSFYYKPDRPSTPQASFALECVQWRHGDEAEPFVGEIHVPTDDDEVTGLLVCCIQAANLSQSVSSRMPVRISISHVSAFENASTLVDTLIEFPEYQFDVTFRQSDTSK